MAIARDIDPLPQHRVSSAGARLDPYQTLSRTASGDDEAELRAASSNFISLRLFRRFSFRRGSSADREDRAGRKKTEGDRRELAKRNGKGANRRKCKSARKQYRNEETKRTRDGSSGRGRIRERRAISPTIPRASNKFRVANLSRNFFRLVYAWLAGASASAQRFA